MAENISCSVCDALDSFYQDGDTLYSFPDARRNPVVYVKWCEALSIDPKQGKLKKLHVCHKHFAPKDIDQATGALKPRAVPRMSLSQKDARPKFRAKAKKHDRYGVRKRGRPSKENHNAKKNPTNFEKTSDDDDDAFIDELLLGVRLMNRQEKEIFQSEMMELIIEDIL